MHPQAGEGMASSDGSGDTKSSRLLGVLVGLLSSVCASLAFLSIKSLGNGEKAIVMTLWFHATAAIASVFPLLVSFPSPPVVPTLFEASLLLHIGWTSFIGQLLISRGFQLLSPSRAAAINLTQVVHARLLSTLVLHDAVSWPSFAGSGLIGLGVLAVQLGKDGGTSNSVSGLPSGKEQERPARNTDEVTLLAADNATGAASLELDADGEQRVPGYGRIEVLEPCSPRESLASVL